MTARRIGKAKPGFWYCDICCKTESPHRKVVEYCCRCICGIPMVYSRLTMAPKMPHHRCRYMPSTQDPRTAQFLLEDCEREGS